MARLLHVDGRDVGDLVLQSPSQRKSLLKNPVTSVKMSLLTNPDARPPGVQQLPVLQGVDRGADPGQSSAAADPGTGGSGP